MAIAATRLQTNSFKDAISHDFRNVIGFSLVSLGRIGRKRGFYFKYLLTGRIHEQTLHRKHALIIDEAYRDLGIASRQFSAMRNIIGLFAEAGEDTGKIVDVEDAANGLDLILMQNQRLVEHTRERIGGLTLDGRSREIIKYNAKNK